MNNHLQIAKRSDQTSVPSKICTSQEQFLSSHWLFRWCLYIIQELKKYANHLAIDNCQFMALKKKRFKWNSTTRQTPTLYNILEIAFFRSPRSWSLTAWRIWNFRPTARHAIRISLLTTRSSTPVENSDCTAVGNLTLYLLRKVLTDFRKIEKNASIWRIFTFAQS